VVCFSVAEKMLDLGKAFSKNKSAGPRDEEQVIGGRKLTAVCCQLIFAWCL